MQNKKTFLIVILVIILAVLSLSLYLALTPYVLLPKPLQSIVSIFEKEPTVLDTTYNPIPNTTIFYTPDYNENIYNDETFVELMNLYALEFIQGEYKYKLSEDDLEKQGGKLAVFFYEHFTNIRNGDADAFNSDFDSRAFLLRKKLEKFTMQQIYEISIEALNIAPSLDEEEYSWVFEDNIEPIFVDVRYKIRRNNGTFRYDLGSDSVKPQLYILYEDSGEYKIIDIVDYSPIYL